MTRDKWKDILEGIRFVAIVLSLLFVGIETRNSSKQTKLNTQAVEIAAYQELMNNIAKMNAMHIQDVETAKVIGTLYGTPTDINAWRSLNVAYLMFRHGDIAFFMFERGALDEARLRSSLRILPLYQEAGRTIWQKTLSSPTETA